MPSTTHHLFGTPPEQRRFALGLRSVQTVAVLTGSLTLACAEGQVDDTDDGTFETSETMTGDGDGDPTGDGDGDGDDDPTGDGDGDPTCTSIGCDCDGSPQSCDSGLACVDGVCSSA